MSTREFIQLFLMCVEAFFVVYMVGYASFLFLSVRWVLRSSMPPDGATSSKMSLKTTITCLSAS